MKVICNRGALLEALTVTGNVVQGRTPKPVLQCVKLTASDDRLDDRSDGSGSRDPVRRYTGADRASRRNTAQPAKFRDIVRESVDDTLSIEVVTDKKAEHSPASAAQDSHFKIFTQKSSRVPAECPILKANQISNSPADQFKQLIARHFSAARERSGRYIQWGPDRRQGKKISLISTDGRRPRDGQRRTGQATNSLHEGAKVIDPSQSSEPDRQTDQRSAGNGRDHSCARTA